MATVDAVEKERAILERLERIDGLREEDAPAGVLLDEVRALLADAEDWVREDQVPSAPRTRSNEPERRSPRARACSSPRDPENPDHRANSVRSRGFAAQWMRAGLHEDRSKWGH